MDINSAPPTAGVAEVTIGDTTLVDIEAVYTDADTRLYGIKGDVITFPEETGLNLGVENPVLVVDGEGKTIGTARVYLEKFGVVAEALIQYGCPERLDLEEGLSLYFHPESSVNYLYGTDEAHNVAAICIDARLEALKAGLDEDATQDLIKTRVAKAAETPAKVVPYILVNVKKLLLSSDKAPHSCVSEVVPMPIAAEES